MHPLELYLTELAGLRGATKETSGYPALSNLLNAAGQALKPKVKCVIHPKNSGAGIPDGGLFTPDQSKGRDEEESFINQNPARGAIEVKSAGDDLAVIGATPQIKDYVDHYGQVLLTNYRDFLLLKRVAGHVQKLETFHLAADEKAFWIAAAHPRKTADALGERLTEYLKRVMLHNAPLNNPKDVAFFLASYARDARVRVEAARDLPALQAVRAALEEALGMKFEADKGEHFFRSTLVQTLFYGVFSAWVLWHKENPLRQDDFDWRSAAWTLHVPMIKALFEQVATPTKLGPLGLVEVLDWTASALNRVERNEFFAKFVEEHAVQYFYEPFLEAFDPDLRKQLGVWYTPPEIVKYQVARVDTALREELDIADGLADPRVFVLDPCCGTGAYLVEVLRKIEKTLKEEKGEGALAELSIKEAAQKRVFGFEILPAPFVVAHLQMGLLLQNLAVPLDDAKNERAGIFLTNALTGWDFAGDNPKLANWPELEAERKGAGKVKQEKPILVIIGNPPYNAFAGVSPEEEQGLVEPYKAGLAKEWGIKKFNLDDLYVRFFRIAERRIAEKTGQGIVSFISNYSYLSDPSFVVMRKRFLQEFDSLWFDCLNGDSRETGKLTPEGKPDPSVFSTEYNREGIRVGTTICLNVRKPKRCKKPDVYFRQLWGVNKRAELLESLNLKEFVAQYGNVNPAKENWFSFCPSEIAGHYFQWPSLMQLSAVQPAYGHMETRGLSLISHDKQQLEIRLQKFFDESISNEEMTKISPEIMAKYARYDGITAREVIQKKMNFSAELIRRFEFKPFDIRFCYADARRPLWAEPSTALSAQAWKGNAFLISRLAGVRSPEGYPVLYSASEFERDVISGHARAFPFRLRITPKAKSPKKDDGNGEFGILHEAARAYRVVKTIANLSASARNYLSKLSICNCDDDAESAALIWMHALAIGYSPVYLGENADGIRQDWPRIPLPNTEAALRASAGLGKQVAALLDTETLLAGVANGNVRPELKSIAVLSSASDLSVTAGWGHAGQNGVTMPGKGKLETRGYAADEMALPLLGHATHDVFLNEAVCWRNVPEEVWKFTIGGYQVIKKWLSYREFALLGRALTPDEAREVTHMARRIAALVLLQPELDQNYTAVKEATLSL